MEIYLAIYFIGIIAVSTLGIVASLLSGQLFLGIVLVLALIIGIYQYKNRSKLHAKVQTILTVPVLWVLFNTFFLKYQNVGILNKFRVSFGITLFWFLASQLVAFIVGLFIKRKKVEKKS